MWVRDLFSQLAKSPCHFIWISAARDQRSTSLFDCIRDVDRANGQIVSLVRDPIEKERIELSCRERERNVGMMTYG